MFVVFFERVNFPYSNYLVNSFQANEKIWKTSVFRWYRKGTLALHWYTKIELNFHSATPKKFIKSVGVITTLGESEKAGWSKAI